jgi:hypothetical protein
MRRVVAALQLEHPMVALLRVYSLAIRGYPGASSLFRALLQLHEIENVKLVWRAKARGMDRDAVGHLWIDLTPLATFSGDVEGTPYAGIAKSIARAHGRDLAASELALDRWASQQVLGETRRLPRRESVTRRLLELVVRERDSEIVRRGAKWYGLTSIGGVAEDVLRLRRERLRLCHRAFVGSPFLLAPAVAVVLLAEEEVRSVRALVERAGDERLDLPLARTLAASELGA